MNSRLWRHQDQVSRLHFRIKDWTLAQLISPGLKVQGQEEIALRCPNSIFCWMKEQDTTKPVLSPESGNDAHNPQIQEASARTASESLGGIQTTMWEAGEQFSLGHLLLPHTPPTTRAIPSPQCSLPHSHEGVVGELLGDGGGDGGLSAVILGLERGRQCCSTRNSGEQGVPCTEQGVSRQGTSPPDSKPPSLGTAKPRSPGTQHPAAPGS